MEINEIKQRLPITKLLAHYGLKPDPSTSPGRANHIHCPFHDDQKPSCKIYPETNTYHCFACGKTGDVIQFIQDKEKCSQRQAILMATTWAEGSTNANTTPPAKPTKTQQATDYTTLFPRFLTSLEKSEKAQKYGRERSLDYKTLPIGYNSGKYHNKLKNCLIFPLKNKEGNICSLYGRRITETPASAKASAGKNGYNAEYGKHYYSENRHGVYPCYPAEETELLILTEAIIDAATLLQIPEITSQFTILSCFGNLAFTKETQEAVKNLKKLHEVIIFFDGDQGGLDGIKHVTEIMQQIKPKVKVTAVETPQKEDVNSLFVKYDKDCLLQLINERKPVNELSRPPVRDVPFSSFEKNSIEKKEVHLPAEASAQAGTQNFASPLITENPNKIIYETQTARYIVKGSLPKQLDKMLISLDVQHLETGLKYRCRLDLYEEKQTRKEAREAAEKLDLRADLIENDLSNLCDLLEEHREATINQSFSEHLDPMPDLPTQAKCKDFLAGRSYAKDGQSSSNLINKINKLIGQSGITGEYTNRLFLFVLATSYKMPETLHALIQGSSGSGKTHLLGKIADLMPSERVERFTRITDNSLYNYGEYDLQHRLLCLEDVDGLGEEALFAWRELISNNMLRSSTSQKDDNGNSRGAKRIVRGPMASMCATTHGHIYEDNMSRLFTIAVDESLQQTARIIEHQSKLAAGLIKKEDETQAKEFLQNCIRMLKPYTVVNPYADQIKLPQQAHKIRRLHELFLCFVKQITLINQYQRKKDTQGRLITEKKDLKTAVEIMFDSIFLKVDELDGSLRQFFENLKTYIQEKENPQNYEFAQREIRQALNLSKSAIHRYLTTLIELEYISVSGGYQNRGLKYKISYWDNVAKLREYIRQHLNNQLDNL